VRCRYYAFGNRNAGAGEIYAISVKASLISSSHQPCYARGWTCRKFRLVAILDADKEGFLRSTARSSKPLDAARANLNGLAILYADRMTDSMKAGDGRDTGGELSKRPTTKRRDHSGLNQQPSAGSARRLCRLLCTTASQTPTMRRMLKSYCRSDPVLSL